MRAVRSSANSIDKDSKPRGGATAAIPSHKHLLHRAYRTAYNSRKNSKETTPERRLSPVVPDMHYQMSSSAKKGLTLLMQHSV